jgi:hypothetical protein
VTTLGDRTTMHVELSMARFGAWRANVVLSHGEAPDIGATTLVVGDLELSAYVLIAGLDAPERPRATVVGGHGWELPLLAPLSYQSDAGVRLRTVLTDLASRAGETVEQPTDRSVGSHYAVPASPRSTTRLRDVLSALHRGEYVEPWRVDPDGVTRFGARAGVDVTDLGLELRRDAAVGARILNIDSPASFLPGNIYDGETIVRTVVRESSSNLEASLWH